MKHLLDTVSLSREDSISILDIAEEMTQVSDREVKKLPVLRGRTVVNLFFEDSTRTRLSFEAAAKRLSADVLNFSAKGSSVSKGESLQDTIQTISAMGADALVVRHPGSGTPHRLAHTGWIDVPVVNAGDGTHEHPTQALLDAFTLRRALGGFSASGAVKDGPRGRGLDGAKVAIVGDVLHSRVARSNVHLLANLGAEVHLVAPPTLLPWGVETWPVTLHYDLDEALHSEDFAAVMMLRVQHERMHESFFPNEREYARLWGLSAARLAGLPKETFIMHPGPMNRGFEISAAAADSPRALILDQVENGVSVRMAVLYRLLTGQEETND
ncbi:MAG: aspartate carbamoyltransferase catalytic subunit [Brevibacterium aurantiacum]|uniref:Aspartate carbamoyltransferase n=1 Tax=Brevibacterium aurantiacum TaxID=273384 RepID=A0A2A3ZDI7_BREAU|nr:aspartate carbamoyltransferase catalytic subunit [Brevibacterium aurantiacum]MDN5549108.1 aspartate carbamoyltransferase catalytic subunit [Brevibacterium sp.]AZL06018.1 aspartate carbamoyltransferase catalytic subunit [Brevibacterium aurantiacum]AZL09579.1 aspartate carbamoyltransferase catalytic subunit [Brevibacterium aurantiacum]AZT97496.1 aspartate carbamoyltransferase catalytic subunit [Brevibacterium aurantiacum]MDN5592814.1 aspartate carbamoyltransferase catalytic subunit [Brevibact